jgi:hypothetical protein
MNICIYKFFFVSLIILLKINFFYLNEKNYRLFKRFSNFLVVLFFLYNFLLLILSTLNKAPRLDALYCFCSCVNN